MENIIGASPIPSPMPERRNIVSILIQIAEPIARARKVEDAQRIILDFVNTYKISKDGPEYKALADIARHTDLKGLVKHFYDSLLRYEKLGLNKIK